MITDLLIAKGLFKDKTEYERERAEIESSRERLRREAQEAAAKREADLRHSTIPGHHWDGDRLIRESNDEIVLKIEVTDTKWSEGWMGTFSYPIEWQTTDKKRFASLAAAKRHQESLIIR